MTKEQAEKILSEGQAKHSPQEIMQAEKVLKDSGVDRDKPNAKMEPKGSQAQQKARKENNALVKKSKKETTKKETPKMFDPTTGEEVDMNTYVDQITNQASELMNDFQERDEETNPIAYENKVQRAEEKYNKETPEKPVDFTTGGEDEVSEELKDELFNTDEGQIGQDAIDSGDISETEKIVDPETNEPFVQPTYDQDGRVTALKPLVPNNAELYSKKTAIMLTLLSVVVSALSGGVFPPINFMNLRWDDAKNKAADLENETIRIYNGEVDEANKKVIETRGTEGALQSAQDNPELYGRETTDALARGKAAEAGNVALEQTQINAELQKALQENGYKFDIGKMKLSNEQQIAMAELLYDQEVKKVVNEIQNMIDKGFTTDQIAKYMSSMQGNTNVGRFFQYFGQGTQGAANLVDIFKPGSDKVIKKFDARPVNTTLLKKSFKWR